MTFSSVKILRAFSSSWKEVLKSKRSLEPIFRDNCPSQKVCSEEMKLPF